MGYTIAIGILLIATRIWIGANVEPEEFQLVQVYKDIAHLFMGGLCVAWWLQRNRWQWRLFWVLNAVEVAVAIWSRV